MSASRRTSVATVLASVSARASPGEKLRLPGDARPCRAERAESSIAAKVDYAANTKEAPIVRLPSANQLPEALRVTTLVLAAAALLLSSGCAGAGASSGEDGKSTDPVTDGGGGRADGERVKVGGTEALVWGEGDYGVVLSHGAAYDAADWEPQAREIAGKGMVALAVEDISTQSISDAAGYLKDERGVDDVALIGASAGTGGVLGAAEADPELPDQLILLSGTGDVSGLGEYPKLFVASEDEGLAGEVRQMAEKAPGEENEALILPGDAHAQAIFRAEEGERLMNIILERLQRWG